MPHYKLVLTFKDIAGNDYSLTIKDVKKDLANDAVKAVMDYIVANKIFASKKGDLVSRDSAVLVTSQETPYAID